jgi:predicted dehydrogenase
MKDDNKTSRRTFLSNSSKIITGATVGSFLPNPLISSEKNKILSANESIKIGLIGCKSMGFYNLSNALKLPNVECIALCDIDDTVLKERSAEVEKKQGRAPTQYKDYRKMLENKDLDAVIIGTPDHWHCLPFVAACEAGKDIYVEKPLANSIAECEVMVKATRKHNRVVQVGQQQRSGEHWQKAMNFMRQGKIGQIRKVQIWANFEYGVGDPKVADSAVPAGVDFNMWLGPAPERTFNNARFHGNWRMFWDYGGGLLSDWGVHLIDMALWVKDTKDLPLSITASGGNLSHPDFAHETFDTMSVAYQLKDYTISWEHTAGIQSGPYGRLYGLAYIGNDATLVIDREGWEVFPESANGAYKVPAIPKQSGQDSHQEHMKNFLECIKTRKDPNCTIEIGRLVALYAHMGNIALRTQSQLKWNETTKNFGTNTAANALIQPNYRKPWVFPKY